jgi:hypothetical protein
MFQEIITYIIVFSAVAYTLFSLVKSFSGKEKGNCNSGCGCSAKNEFKDRLLKNYKFHKPE